MRRICVYLRKPLRKVYQKTLRKFYQTRGMQRIPQHCASRSIGLSAVLIVDVGEP